MFEQAGFAQGESDAYQDAVSGLCYRPRPSLARSVISPGFQRGYMWGYQKSYFNTKQALIREAMRDEKCRQIAEKHLTKNLTEQDKPFDMGWEDGFQGKASIGDRLRDEAERSAYRRGYKLGYRDRDHERAKALRLNKTQLHERTNSQDQIDREF